MVSHDLVGLVDGRAGAPSALPAASALTPARALAGGAAGGAAAERAALGAQWSPLPVFSGLQATPRTPHSVHCLWTPASLLFRPRYCHPRGVPAASAFPVGSGLWLPASCRDSQWPPGGTSPAPSWAYPDKMGRAAHWPAPLTWTWIPRQAAGQLDSWTGPGDHPRQACQVLTGSGQEEARLREAAFEQNGNRLDYPSAAWPVGREQGEQ